MSGWVEAFVVIAAIAIVIQMAILVAMFVQMKTAIEQFTRIATDLQNRIDPILLRSTAYWKIPKIALRASWATRRKSPASLAARAKDRSRLYGCGGAAARADHSRRPYFDGHARSGRRVRREIPPHALDSRFNRPRRF